MAQERSRETECRGGCMSICITIKSTISICSSTPLKRNFRRQIPTAIISTRVQSEFESKCSGAATMSIRFLLRRSCRSSSQARVLSSPEGQSSLTFSTGQFTLPGLGQGLDMDKLVLTSLPQDREDQVGPAFQCRLAIVSGFSRCSTTNLSPFFSSGTPVTTKDCYGQASHFVKFIFSSRFDVESFLPADLA